MSLVRSVGAALLVFLALANSGCSAESNAPAVLELEVLSFESFFPKKVDVFGIPIHATNRAPDSKVLHAAGILAQFLDNDADGRPDDSYLVETIIEHDGRLFMAVDRNELDAIFEVIERDYPGSLAKTAWWVSPEGITPGDSVWQDLQAEETIPLAGQDLQFDGSLEEILHLITHVGLTNAYPEAFAEAPGSRLADAMDSARGGQFLGVPEVYPENATYSYYDETCVYQCQVTEYVYWALTSLMGGQDSPGRLKEIGEEWKLNTPEKLAAGDPDVFALLTDPEYRLPRILPDGNYRGATLAIVTD
jgi:hypothetical protein